MFTPWAVINEDLLYAHALATDHTWYGMDWYCFFCFFFGRRGVRRQREQEHSPDFPTPLGPLQLSLPSPTCSNTVLTDVIEVRLVVGRWRMSERQVLLAVELYSSGTGS